MDAIETYFALSGDVMRTAAASSAFRQSVTRCADILCGCMRSGGKVLLIGNGGSAGDAQHIAGELVGRLNFDRAPLAALALTTDTSVITAIANDYGYEQVFERQVQALGREGDVLIAISTSGCSSGVLRAMEAACAKRLTVIGWSGASGGLMPERAHIMLHAPAEATPLIQQVHMAAAHMICALVEERLFPRPDGQGYVGKIEQS